jgi:hypothetical protein
MGSARQMLYKLKLLVFFAACLPFHGAWPQQAVSIEVLESGLYRAEAKETIAAPGAVTGTSGVLKGKIVFYENTSRVPAMVGTSFGFRFRVLGIPAGAEVAITKITHFPPPGLTNPATGRMQASDTARLRRRGGDVTVTGYGFDNPWEAAPGEWRIELWDGDRKLVEQRYTVVR